MSEFKRIADEHGGWDDYDWSKPSLAVVAMGERGGCVLWTVGAHVAFDMSEVGLGCGLDDLGIEPDDEGVFVWEGKTKSSRCPEGDYDSWLEGEFRAPTEDEWASIRRGGEESEMITVAAPRLPSPSSCCHWRACPAAKSQPTTPHRGDRG